MGGIGHEIVDVEILAREQFFLKPITGHGADYAVIFQRGEVETLALQPPDLADEFRGNEMRPKLGHDGETTRDLGIGLGGEDVHG
jgi:hypothetical protein